MYGGNQRKREREKERWKKQEIVCVREPKQQFFKCKVREVEEGRERTRKRQDTETDGEIKNEREKKEILQLW